jgi:CO/xanthine dehydrogenase Mo-binding subunit
MDELAAVSGADPVQFRLRHLNDGRAIAVIEAVAKLANWQAGHTRAGSGNIVSGRGMAYAQYETATAYAAVIADVEVDRSSGAVRVKKVYVAHDCGLIINPDGVKNQIEGNVVQTISRALKEEVRMDAAGVQSRDWASYPILRFSEVPEAIEIALINRPDQLSVGAGEPAACPVPAALANAIFAATGARVRAYPLLPERVKAALA